MRVLSSPPKTGAPFRSGECASRLYWPMAELFGCVHKRRTFSTEFWFLLVWFALAHVTLYVRQAVGVFPTLPVALPVRTATSLKKTTLREALRIYWWTLIGIGVFPLIFIVGGTFLHIPFEFFILPFLAVGLLAGLPFLSGKVPYSFWLVAMTLWLVGGICAGILMQLIDMLLA